MSTKLLNKHNVAGFLIGVCAFTFAGLVYQANDSNIVMAAGTWALIVLVGGGIYALCDS